jgi:DNA-binding transcriptional MerR regulator
VPVIPTSRRGRTPAGTGGPTTWLSLGPSSKLLGVDPDTLRRWADTGRVRTFTTPGGHRRFLRADLLRLEAARSAAPRSLSSLGATPERVKRAYARSYRSTAQGPTPESFEPVDREAFRAEGRRLVELLLAYLDTSDAVEREALEAEARKLVAGTARRLAEAEVDTARAVEAFVAARRPFLAELANVGLHRSLDVAAMTGLYDAAASLLDRLLLHFVTYFNANARDGRTR